MIVVAALVLMASVWLLWEWRSGALVPAEPAVGRRIGVRPTVTSKTSAKLPTAAALRVDADASSRCG